MQSVVLNGMTQPEAMEWKSKVGGTANHLRSLLLDGYERDAWKPLGYANWTDCLKSLADEYGISERHLWRLHAANETEKQLTPGSVGELPEKTLRPLTSLEPEARREVYHRATENAPDGKVTAAHIEATKREYQASVAAVPAPPVDRPTPTACWCPSMSLNALPSESIRCRG